MSADRVRFKMTERFEDMSPLGRLRIIQQEDGDIIISIAEDPNEPKMLGPSAEFCIPGTGGGQSRHTHAALKALFEAIKRDNQEAPQRRGKNGITPEEL